jgi:hypothetical protein
MEIKDKSFDIYLVRHGQKLKIKGSKDKINGYKLTEKGEI